MKKAYIRPEIHLLKSIPRDKMRAALRAEDAGDPKPLVDLLEQFRKAPPPAAAAKLEPCVHCTYENEALLDSCAFHRLKPDPSTHVDFAPGYVAPPPPAVALELEPARGADPREDFGSPRVIGQEPCGDCARGVFCPLHTGQTRLPFFAPEPEAE